MQSSSKDSKSVPSIAKKGNSYVKTLANYLDGTQMFFLLFTIPFVVGAPYFLYTVYEVVERQKAMRPDYVGPYWPDFLWLIITLPSISFGKYLTYLVMSGVYERRLPAKYTGDVRKLKIHKGCDNVFKVIYFIGISIYGYFAVIVKLPFDSPMLGNGTWKEYYAEYPYGLFMRASTYYCMLNLSYHTESMITMIFWPRMDFYEMLCHHVCTFLVISCSYIQNYSNQCVLTMIVIDNGDIFIGLIRVFLDISKSTTVITLAYAGMMISFFYTRIILYPTQIVMHGCLGNLDKLTDRLFPHYCITTMMFTLGILNFYWFALMIRMGYRFYAGYSPPTDMQCDETKFASNKQKNE